MNEASQTYYRWAEAHDVAAIVALVERAYRGEPSRLGWTTEAHLLDGQRTDVDEVASVIGAADARLLLGLRADVLVASVLVRASATDDPRRAAYIGMFAVEPALQAAGIGRALLVELERRIVAEQLGTRARMTVIAQRSELIAWYERRGYRFTGEREAFPYGQPRFGIPRQDDLSFVVLEKQLAG